MPNKYILYQNITPRILNSVQNFRDKCTQQLVCIPSLPTILDSMLFAYVVYVCISNKQNRDLNLSIP